MNNKFVNLLRIENEKVFTHFFSIIEKEKFSKKFQNIVNMYDIKDNWHVNLLEHLKNDKEHFGMEDYEPLCNNQVPREGVCIRINNDPCLRCFKVKTTSFKLKEAILIDSGEVDMEMEDNYVN